jgi:hypothetical protein
MLWVIDDESSETMSVCTVEEFRTMNPGEFADELALLEAARDRGDWEEVKVGGGAMPVVRLVLCPQEHCLACEEKREELHTFRAPDGVQPPFPTGRCGCREVH